MIAPPCEPTSDVRLPICDRSCEVFTKLRSDCTRLDNFVIKFAENRSDDHQILSDLYLNIDCRNISTYDLYGTLKFTQDGECTSILSPDTEGQTHVRNKVP